MNLSENNVLFKIEEIKDQKDKINIYPENLLTMQSHHSIISAKLLIDGKVITIAYFPIPLYKDKNVFVSNIVTEIQSGGNYNNIIDGEYFNKTNNTTEQLVASISSSFGSDDIYKPQIIDGIFTDNATFIEDLKALYCYDFIDIDELVAAIPALRINVPRKKNNELPIGTSVTNPKEGQITYSLKAINNEEQYYPYKIIKSDLSSGKLTENEGKSYYNGLVVGQVQQRITDNKGIHSYEKPKYGIYGFKEDEMTFSINEEGDAFFKGKVEAGSGSIGNWNVETDGSLSGKDEDGKTIILNPSKASIEIGGLELSPNTINLSIEGEPESINVGTSIKNINDDINSIEGVLGDLEEDQGFINQAIGILNESIKNIETSLVLDVKPEDGGGRWMTISYIPSNITPVQVKGVNDELIDVIPYSQIKTLNVFIKGEIQE